MSVRRRGIKMPPHLAEIPSQGVKAGVLEGATYPERTYKNVKTGEMIKDVRGGKPVAYFAAALEYGAHQDHPRPFMRQTVANEKKAWTNATVTLLKSGTPFVEALMTVGQMMQEDIQDTIRAWPADNSEEWAQIKGFSKGLFFSSHLVNSISSAIYDVDS